MLEVMSMRNLGSLSVALLFAVLSGCASETATQIDPRATYPDAGTGNPDARMQRGTLTVYTPVVVDPTSGRAYMSGHDQPAPRVHSGYTLFHADGKSPVYVRNHTMMPSTDEEPSEITLPVGRYLVRPDLAPEDARTFWVTIETGKETQVDPSRLTPRRPLESR